MAGTDRADGKKGSTNRLAMIGVAVALLIATGAMGYGYTTGTWGPKAAAAAYFAAAAAGDARGAWSRVEIADPPAGSDVQLLSEPDLASAISSGDRVPRPSSIADPSVVGPGTVAVTVTMPAGRAVSQTMVRDDSSDLTSYLPRWRLWLKPVQLVIEPPAGTGSIEIDGRSFAIVQGRPLKAAVLPVRHRVSIKPSGALFQAQTTTVDVLGAPTQPAGVSFAPKLTTAGEAAAAAAVRAAITACAASNSPTPAGCPQALAVAGTSAVTWSVVGDPMAEVVIKADDTGQLAAVGHYQMIGSFTDSRDSAARKAPSGGAYSARLTASGDQLVVASVSTASTAGPVTRPVAATDAEAIRSAVAAITVCAGRTSVTPSDCPQYDSRAIGRIRNVGWRMTGDPGAGAQVTFDGSTGLFHVRGPLPMVVDYDLVELVTSHYTEASTTTFYRADLFWDGGAFQLISVSGLLS